MEAAGRPSGPEPVFGFKLGPAFGCDEPALRRAPGGESTSLPTWACDRCGKTKTLHRMVGHDGKTLCNGCGTRAAQRRLWKDTKGTSTLAADTKVAKTPLVACSVCAQPTATVCGGCKCIRFCSRECMKKSWPTHRLKCDLMKRIREQIKRGKYLALSENDASRADDLARVAAFYAQGLQSIKEPSRRANGRLRGKQSRCSNVICKDRDAVGLRYVYFGAKPGFKNNTKESTCEKCWVDMLEKNCGSRLRVNQSGALTDLAQGDFQIGRAINAGILKV